MWEIYNKMTDIDQQKQDYYPKKYDFPVIRKRAMYKRQSFYISSLFLGFLAVLFGYTGVYAITLQIFSVLVISEGSNLPDYQAIILAIASSSLAIYLIKTVFRAESISTEIPQNIENTDESETESDLLARVGLVVTLAILIPTSAFLALRLQQVISGVNLLNALSELSGLDQAAVFAINLSILVGISGAVGIFLSSLALLFLVALYRTEMRIYVWLKRVFVLIKHGTRELSEEEYKKRCPQCYNNAYSIEEVEEDHILCCETCGLEKSKIELD